MVCWKGMRTGWMAVVVLSIASFSLAQSSQALLGSWNGTASGPDGSPPTGAIRVTFEQKEGEPLKGKFAVKASEKLEYGGEVERISLKDQVMTAVAIFKLGENPLEVHITGPLKGNRIQGTFSVFAKGQKLGEGTFEIAREEVRPRSK